MAPEPVGVRFTAEGTTAFLADMDRANDSVRRFADDAGQHSGRFSGFMTSMGQSVTRFGQIAAVGLAAGAVALGGFISSSISAASTYESTLNRFSAVTGDALGTAGIELAEFSDLFLQLGMDTQFSSQQAADAAVELAKGGVPVAEIMGDALEATLNLAAAGELELAPAAEIVAKQLGVWRSEGVTAAEVTDLLAQAANASTVDVDELALGLANVGGVGKIAGLDLEEVVTTMALLAPGFSSAADAGTSFKTFLSRLQPTTDPAAQAMAKLGLYTAETGSAFYDAKGDFIGMEQASQLLYESTKDLSEAERILAFQTIFGADAVRAAAIISEQGRQGYLNMAASMDAAGTAAEQAKLRNQGFGFALDQLKGSFETFQIIVGTAVLPVLTAFISGVTTAFNTVMEWTKALLGADNSLAAIGTRIALLATIENVIPGFNAFLASVQAIGSEIASTLGPAIDAVVGFLGDHLGPILISTAAVLGGAVVAAVVSFTAALVAAAAPILILIAVGAALYEAWTTDFLGIQTLVTGWWNEYLQPAFASLTAWLSTNIPIAIQTLSTFWTGTLQPALSSVWAFIQDPLIPTLIHIGTTVFNTVSSGVQTLAGFWTDTLKPALDTVWAFIQDPLIPLFESLTNVHMAANNKATEALAGLWTNVLKPALDAVWDFIQKNVIPILQDMKKDLEALGTVVRDNAGTALTWLKDALLGPLIGAFGGLTSAIQTATGWINDLADSIGSLELPSWLQPGSPTPLENAMWTLGESFGFVASQTSPLQAGLDGIGQRLQRLQTGFQGTQFAGQHAFDAIIQGVPRVGVGLDGFRIGVENVTNALGGAEQAGAGAFSSIAQNMSPLGQAISNMVGGIGSVAGAFGSMEAAAQAAFDASEAAFRSGGGGGGGLAADFGSGGFTPPSIQFPGRAEGGPVERNQGYMVGERGPEWFSPEQDGGILSNRVLESFIQSFQQSVAPPMSASQIMTRNATTTNNQTINYNLSAQYAYQSEQTLIQQVRQLRMMESGGY